MKKLFVLVVVVLISGCASEVISLEKEKLQFEEVQIADVKYYFKYPAEALMNSKDKVLSYKNCDVNFGQNPDFTKFAELELEDNKKGQLTYNAWYKDDILVAYAVVLHDWNFAFWMEAVEVGGDCIGLIDDAAESFSDELIYENERLGFSARLPADFKVEYLPNDAGMVLKKWVEKKIVLDNNLPKDPKEVDVFEPYRLEMGITAIENLDDFESLADFVGKNYPGYTIAAKDFEKFSGYLVNETVVLDAVSHFFVMSSDGSLIYDIYLRVPGKRYLAHEKEFEKFVKGVEF